jgi:hypothetical protein
MSAVILAFPSPLIPYSRDGYECPSPGAASPLVDLAGTLGAAHRFRSTRAQEIAAILRAPRDDGPAAA